MHQTPEERWRAILTGSDPSLPAFRRRMRMLPSSPRCKTCLAPFAGIGGWWMRRLGRGRWPKNPRYCGHCESQFEGLAGSGAEVEISLLFADARGSTTLAERMSPSGFGELMNRFYATATDVLVDHDAVVDKFVGDEVVALFVPAMVGPGHAGQAVAAARALLAATGHGRSPDPWLPIGVGVHTGIAFVGLLGAAGGEMEFTALGDAVNVAARLASAAGSGEALVSSAAAERAGLATAGLERRHLDLRGRTVPVDAVVLAA